MREAVFATNFTAVDWVIVALYLSMSVAIGLFANRFIARLSDYLVAGRGLKIYLAVATMTGTELGLVTVMYNAEQGFIGGFAGFHIGVVWSLACLAVGLTGLIVYKLRKARVMTIPEYYEQRFGKRVRWLGGVVLAFSGILNMGLFLQAGSRFVIGVTGLEPGSAAVKWVMTLMLLLVLLYTTLGGMVSVVITDYLQFVVLSAGMAIITVLATTQVGWENLFRVPLEHLGERGATWFNPLASQEYGLTYLIWMVFISLSAVTLWQSATLRALSAQSPQVAQRLYAWSSITFLARVIIPMFWGICAYVFVVQNPVLRERFFPANPAQALSSQYAMPIFLAKILPTGLLGLVVAGMMAAFMSTHDSYLLCWSAVLTQDIIAPLCRRPLSDRARILLTRIWIVLIGVFLLIWGLWYEAPVSLWNYMAGTGTIYLAGAFAVIVGGLYWKRASSTGALIAILCGLCAVPTIIPGAMERLALTDKEIAVLTFILCGVGMVVGSLLFPDRPKEEEGS
ncbi:MAG TPA: sodium:solute symporter family protein [Armatimonadetes bacterium]|nr:sodium:solute symporter family protein [Armatimonadota bacterium]